MARSSDFRPMTASSREMLTSSLGSKDHVELSKSLNDLKGSGLAKLRKLS